MIHNDEIGNTLDADLLEITKSIINESATADNLGRELEAESRKAEKLQDDLTRERLEIDRLRSLLEQQSAEFRQFTEKSDQKLQVMSTRAETAEAALAQSRGSTPHPSSALTSPIGLTFQGSDPFSASQSGFAAGTPATNQHGATHGYSTGARSSYRSSDMDPHKRVLATLTKEMDRLRQGRPTDRPTGASGTGSPIPKRASMTTITLQDGTHNQIAHWQGEFNQLFTMVGNYTKTYWKWPPRDFAKTCKEHSALWSYLVKIVNPTNPDQAGGQVTRLLSDKVTVSYLIERAILQFVIENILSIDAWMEWDQVTDKRLHEIEDGLKTLEGKYTDTHHPSLSLTIVPSTVFRTSERQALGDERVALIATRLTHGKWAEYRGYRKSCAFQGLRHIVGPMIHALRLNLREDAGYDLFSIIEEGWALSPKLWGSRLNFKTEFPPLDAVLSNDVHNVLDTGVGPAGGAGVGGAPLRLVITPLVSMRDDRGASVVPYLVCKANILHRN